MKTIARCRTCNNKSVKDNYCQLHWNWYFKGMPNHQRMIRKITLREQYRAEQRIIERRRRMAFA